MVVDGIYYAQGPSAGGAVVAWLSRPWFGLTLFVLALFGAYLFRDPERGIPSGPVAVSPADGEDLAIRTRSNSKCAATFMKSPPLGKLEGECGLQSGHAARQSR